MGLMFVVKTLGSLVNARIGGCGFCRTDTIFGPNRAATLQLPTLRLLSKGGTPKQFMKAKAALKQFMR